MSKTSQRRQSYYDLGKKQAATHWPVSRKSQWRFRKEYNLGMAAAIRDNAEKGAK